MSNRDKAKNPDYIGLALVTIAGAFAGVVGEIISNEEGTPLSSRNIMQAATIGLGAALIFVGTLPLLLSLFSPFSALKDMIKADIRLLIALALIGGFVGEPVWTRGHQVTLWIIDAPLNTLKRSLFDDSDNDQEQEKVPLSPPIEAEDKENGRQANPSENGTGQKAGQGSTAGNLTFEDNRESESSEGSDKERTSRPQDTGEAALTPGGIESERFPDAGEERTLRSSAAEEETLREPSEVRSPLGISKEDVSGYSSGLKIVQSTFCLEMDRPQCKIPALSENIPLLGIRTIENNIRRLYFWTLTEAMEDLEVMHVWSSSDRPDQWSEPIHVSTGAQFPDLVKERLMHETKEYLIKNIGVNLDSFQAVLLDLKRSDRFRTYSSIKAVPGRYTIEVRYLGSQEIVPGGEAKTIIIKPSSETN